MSPRAIQTEVSGHFEDAITGTPNMNGEHEFLSSHNNRESIFGTTTDGLGIELSRPTLDQESVEGQVHFLLIETTGVDRTGAPTGETIMREFFITEEGRVFEQFPFHTGEVLRELGVGEQDDLLGLIIDADFSQNNPKLQA